MELQGKVIAALPQRSGQGRNGEWVAQDFVIETHDAYPRKMAFSVFGADRLQRFNIQIGQEVLVSFDIDAREYQGRWYNSVRAYDVRPADANAAPIPPVGGFADPAQPAGPTSVTQDPFVNTSSSDDTGDLPF